MTARWHPAKDLVGLPGMAGDPKSVRRAGARRGWQCREVAWGRRPVLEWLESSLPLETQTALRLARGEEAPVSSLPAPAADGARETPSAVCLVEGGRAAKLDARVEIVTAFQAAHREGGGPLVPALKQWCAIYNESGAGVSDETRAAIPAIAWNTLQRHRRKLLDRDSAALMAGSGGRTSSIDADPDMLALVEALVYANPNHVTAKHIMRAVKAKLPDRETPSISCVRRWVRRWKAAHAYELSAVAAPDAHRSRTMPAFGAEAEVISALNGLWELDSTRVDVMCAEGRRYAIVAAIDVWSRRVKVLVTPESRATAIAALIRRCILDWGVPDWIRTDEGADYVSKHLRRVVADLGIGHQVLPPYSPDKKPFIERFIGTIARDLFAFLPGFTGHNVAQAQALRERKSFAARRGRDAMETFGCDLTAEELQAKIDAWCETVYAREAHGGLEGLSPFEKAASWTGPRRTVSERGLDVLLAEAAGNGRRKVGKNGIAVDGGLYIAGALGFHMAEWVHVRRDPFDWGRIHVFTDIEEGPAKDRGRFICVAEDPVRTGIDRQAVAAQAKKNARTRDKAARKRARDLEREHKPSEAMDAVLAAAAEDAAGVVAFPARGAAHSTGAMDAAAEAEEAAQRAAQADRDASAGRPSATISLFQKFYGET